MILYINNSLESNNNVFKRDYTGKNDYLLPNTVSNLKEMMEKASNDPRKKKQEFPTFLK